VVQHVVRMYYMINCYNAYNVGIVTMNSMVGLTFDNFKFKRANRVIPLLSVKSSIKVHDYSRAPFQF